MVTIHVHDPILGDFEITPDRYMVIVTNTDTRESREVVVETTTMPDKTEAGAERFVDELLAQPWVVRRAIPMIGNLAVYTVTAT